MISYIFGASPIGDYGYLKNKIKKNAHIICADGGIKHIKALGLSPDVIIGDFDSSENTDEFKNKIVYPAKKDDTDLALAIDYASEKGFSKCVAIGCLGGRLDHTIANIHLMKYALSKNIRLELIDENTKVFLIDNREEIKNEGYKYISVFPLGDYAKGVSYKGLEYSLSDATLVSGIPLGVSNRFSEEYAEVRCKEGLIIVILSERI